jgi:murein L,D-transpeptidase YcbB/YkuD
MQASALQFVKQYAGVIVGSLGILLSVAGVSVAHASSAAAWLAGDQPQRLDEAIEFYTAIAAEGGWDALPADTRLVPGTRSNDVRLLRARLRVSGDFDDERMGADPLLFDIALEDALTQFQRRHGLAETGSVDRQTLTALNQSPAQLLAMLRDSRKRWAELPVHDTGRRVWVNIPEASVAAIGPGGIELKSKTIVGHPSRPTPELSSSIRRIVVHPSWTVPRSIAVNDILPRQLEDSGYLARNNIRVYPAGSEAGGTGDEIAPVDIDWTRLNANNFPYRLRQDPGPANSLGRYKFDFPNDHDVFLHDTPGLSLLGLSYRTLSSGCVRVEQSAALAKWLIAGESAAALTAAEARPASMTVSVRLPEPVAVDIVYLTAWVAPEDGTVQFRYDVYGQVPVM